MSNPSDLFRRAEKNGRKKCVPKPQSPAMFGQDRMPVPQPMQTQERAPAPQQLTPQDRAPAPQPVRQAQPRYPVGGHANYTALMRSHDRMNTRHIPKS